MSLALMEPTGKNVEFAEVMERIANGRSSRELHRLTIANGDKISHSSIADARWGIPPSQKLLARMLKALKASEEDTLDALRAADYLPREKPETLVQRLVEIAETQPGELTYEPDLEQVTIKGLRGAENLQPKSIEVIDRIVRELLAQDRRKQGRE